MITQQRWNTLTLAQQLGNIGSELNRAYSWQQKNDRENRNKSLSRALELIDLSLNDPRWPWRLKEISRLREVVADWFSDQKVYHVPPASIINYCTSLTLLKR